MSQEKYEAIFNYVTKKGGPGSGQLLDQLDGVAAAYGLKIIG